MINKLSIITLFITFVSLSSNLFAQKKPMPPIPKRISGGVINGKAINLPKPAYPAAACGANIRGSVNVAIVIDTDGKVVSAKAVSGHPLLRKASVEAARNSKFIPQFLSGQRVQVSGIIVYNFVGPPSWLSIGTSLGFAQAKGFNSNFELLEGFEAEAEQLNQLREDSAENQKAQLPNIILMIKSKLGATNAWRFEFGIAKAITLYHLNDGDDENLLQSLLNFRSLAAYQSIGVEKYLIERVSKLIEIADKGKITKEEKENIIHYLR